MCVFALVFALRTGNDMGLMIFKHKLLKYQINVSGQDLFRLISHHSPPTSKLAVLKFQVLITAHEFLQASSSSAWMAKHLQGFRKSLGQDRGPSSVVLLSFALCTAHHNPQMSLHKRSVWARLSNITSEQQQTLALLALSHWHCRLVIVWCVAERKHLHWNETTVGFCIILHGELWILFFSCEPVSFLGRRGSQPTVCYPVSATSETKS